MNTMPSVVRIVLATAALLSSVWAIQNFEGPGIVSCPTDAYSEANVSCFPMFADNNPLRCGVRLPSCVLAVLPSLDISSQTVQFALPCECTVAEECPDSCMIGPLSTTNASLPDLPFVPTLTSGNGTDTAMETADFVGPGVVSCPWSDYVADPCVPNYGALLTNCEDTEACTEASVPAPDSENFYLWLPCACVTLENCPASCTLVESLPNGTSTSGANDTATNGIEFTGPGYLVCPIEGASGDPCAELNLSDDCADPSVCGGTEFAFTLDENATSILVPLRCECITAVGCSDTCEFVPGEVPADLFSTPSPSPGDGITAIPTPIVNFTTISPAPTSSGFNFSFLPTSSFAPTTSGSLAPTASSNATMPPATMSDNETIAPNESTAPVTAPTISSPVDANATQGEATTPTRSPARGPGTRSPTLPPKSSGTRRPLVGAFAAVAIALLV
jgi:hypothetical protein